MTSYFWLVKWNVSFPNFRGLEIPKILLQTLGSLGLTGSCWSFVECQASNRFMMLWTWDVYNQLVIGWVYQVTIKETLWWLTWWNLLSPMIYNRVYHQILFFFNIYWCRNICINALLYSIITYLYRSSIKYWIEMVELSLKHGCCEHEPRCLRVTLCPENFRNGHDQTGNHGKHGTWRKWIF